MKHVLVFVLALVLSGCSTFMSKVGEDSEWGEPYSGTKNSPENTSVYLAKAHYHLPQFLITFTFGVADFLASFAADTVLLPVDLGIAVSTMGGEENEDDAEDSN